MKKCIQHDAHEKMHSEGYTAKQLRSIGDIQNQTTFYLYGFRAVGEIIFLAVYLWKGIR